LKDITAAIAAAGCGDFGATLLVSVDALRGSSKAGEADFNGKNPSATDGPLESEEVLKAAEESKAKKS